MDPKLAILFMLFGAIIGLSYLRAEHMARIKDGLVLRRWRKTEPTTNEI